MAGGDKLRMKPKEIYTYDLTLRQMRNICIKSPYCGGCSIKEVCNMLQSDKDTFFPCEWDTDILNTKVVINNGKN